MVLTVALQLVLPLILVASLRFTLVHAAADLVVRAVGTAAILLALHLAGLWTVLPGWLTWIYALFWLWGVIVQARKLSESSRASVRRSLSPWVATLAFCALTLVGLFASTIALRGRGLPNAGTVDIRLPFEEGRFLVVNGGSRALINAHMKTLDESVPRFHAFRGQSYGVDLVRVNRWGLRANGLLPSDPRNYVIYGSQVFAPCDGVVVSARGDRPDMPVPQMDLEVFEGNHVLMRCGDFELLLAHLQQGTVTVKPGDLIESGDLLGLVGNSGRTGEPHLHCSAQRPGSSDAPYSGEPLFLAIDGHFPVRNDTIDAAPR